ncbi:glycosyltransferase family 2 protein [Hyphobacterium sp. CCMP332]|nr:glycosyltransferase family 2 protein [Hyphobacterium sp. CCMP332]
MNKSENKEPLLSICTVAYNHENYINDCLKGLLNQKTNFKYEILVHDDASTDSTQSIIKECESKNRGKIRAIYQSDNQWIRKNINPLSQFLIPKAKGKYLALCEGDDFWIDDNKLQKQVDFLESNPDFNICGHVTGVIIEDNIEYNSEKRPNSKYVGRKLYQKDIVKMMTKVGPTFHTSSFVFRKSALTDKNLISKSTVGDYVILLNMTNYGFAYVLPDEMSVYRKTIQGFSHKNENDSFKHSRNKVKFFSSMNQYTSGKYKELFNPRIVSGYKGLMRYYIEKKNWFKSFYYFLQLIRIDRSQMRLYYELKGLFGDSKDNQG